MFEIKGNVIKITKGDSAVLDIALTDETGQPYEMSSGDRLVITVRLKPGSDILLTTESSTNTLTLTPAMTRNLIVGPCCYDIELRKAGGQIYTVVGMDVYVGSNMIVLPEITEAV